MFWTTSVRFDRCRRFIRSHKRLMVFLTLLLGGVVIGCIFFRAYGQGEAAYLSRVLTITPLSPELNAVISAIYHSCFLPTLLLIVLFFCGLSACGLPVVFLTPLFFGLGIGMSEAYYYSTGWRGVLTVLLLMLPQLLLKSVALLMASAESMRMTLLFSRQLLSEPSPSEGMRPHFRLYILRFLVFLLIILAAGVADVLLRLLCQSWLLVV